LGNLSTPPKVQKLQAALHAKAKDEPEFRFYALYDKIYSVDVLAHAYACCRANKGAAGVDGQTFEQVEAYGVERWLGDLAQELKEGRYEPEAVRRVHIPKPNGRLRPLGIPCLRDRVCQTAAMLVLGPVFDADLQPEQYAYRAGTNALNAVRRVHSLLNTGYRDVVDADLSGYYDTIPHQDLMTSVARRIVDRRVLRLIKMWLAAPVEEVDGRGRVQRTTANRDNKRGTPQGAPISPLLSNLYMRRFIVGWKRSGHERRLGAYIVNYADDIVICCKAGRAPDALMTMRRIMGHLKLMVNEDKTRLCRIPEGQFDFLGYSFGRRYSPKTGRAYIGAWPSKKSVQRMTAAIHEQTTRNMGLIDAEEMVKRLNQMLRGWANYFMLGPITPAYRHLNKYTTSRLRRWLCRKHKMRSGRYTHLSDKHLHESMGLVCLERLPQRLPWAKA
jgi:RNA-directed DNA polymerase